MCALKGERPLEREIAEYLQLLAQCVPESTLVSHKSTLRCYHHWQTSLNNRSKLDAESIAAFAGDLQSKSLSTVKGHIDTLANFQGYLRNDDPTLVKNRVATSLTHGASEAEKEAKYRQKLAARLQPSKPSETSPEAVETTLRYLRQCKSGILEHVFVEVIIETKAKPSLVRGIDQPDFDAESGSIEVGIADEHAVCTAGLVQSRTVSLSRSTVETLDEFTEYEQKTPKTENPVPLFTTTHGRVSESALRRRVKDASSSAFTLFNEQLQEGESHRQVTPSDIWWYAVTNNGDRSCLE